MLKQPSLVPLPAKNQYQLVRDYSVEIRDSLIVVPKYFRYDGASIPAAAWQLTFSPFHPDVMLPALIHDWLFFNHQVEREEADEIFYTLLRQNGVNSLRANTMWAAVRLGGGLFWDNDAADTAMLVELCQKVRQRAHFAQYQFPPAIVQQADENCAPSQ